MVKKELSKEEIELTKQNFDEYKLKYSCAQKVFFKCEKCGAISRKAIKIVHDLLCRKCLIEKTAIERYGSLANMQKMNLEHGKATKKERYGDDNYVNKEKAVATSRAKFGENNYNNRSKCKETLKERYGVENCSQIDSHNEKVKATKLKKYGDENYVNYEKCEQTCLEKYGVENISQLDSTKQKIKSTCLEKYGVENVMQLSSTKEKSKQTSIEKYGTDFPSQAESVKLKAVDTYLKKYGVEHPLQSAKVKEKSKQTCIYRYGVDNPMKFEDIKEKAKSTHYKRYGAAYPMQVESIREKARQTCEERYGSIHPQSRRYSYEGLSFDSSWELCYWIYCRDHGIDIQRNTKEFLKFYFNGLECHYIPDFKVNGEFVEIKGDHFFTEDGIMQCPFDHSKDDLFEAKHQCMLSNNVKILRDADISHIRKYVEEKYPESLLKPLPH